MLINVISKICNSDPVLTDHILDKFIIGLINNDISNHQHLQGVLLTTRKLIKPVAS